MTLRDRALECGNEYNSLIRRLSDIRDDFLRTLDESGIESTGDLIESRSILCMELVRCGEALKPLVQEIERSDAGLDDELRTFLDDIHLDLISLNEDQRHCEAEMSARMAQCRNDLITLEQHSGLRRTYSSNLRDQDARFLDSMR